MAIIRKQAVIESLNSALGTGGEWTATTSGTAGNGDTATGSDSNTTHFTILSSTAQLGIYADVDIRFKFTTGATDDIDVSADDELILPGNTLTFLVIPRGLGASVYFHYVSNSTTTGSVRIVEV